MVQMDISGEKEASGLIIKKPLSVSWKTDGSTTDWGYVLHWICKNITDSEVDTKDIQTEPLRIECPLDEDCIVESRQDFNYTNTRIVVMSHMGHKSKLV